MPQVEVVADPYKDAIAQPTIDRSALIIVDRLSRSTASQTPIPRFVGLQARILASFRKIALVSLGLLLQPATKPATRGGFPI